MDGKKEDFLFDNYINTNLLNTNNSELAENKIIKYLCSLIEKKQISQDEILILCDDSKSCYNIKEKIKSANGKIIPQSSLDEYAKHIFFKLENKISKIDKDPKLIDEKIIYSFIYSNLEIFNLKSVEIKNNNAKIANSILTQFQILKNNGISINSIHSVNFNSIEEKTDMINFLAKYELYKKENNLLDIYDIYEQTINILETDKSNEIEKIRNNFKFLISTNSQNYNNYQLNLLLILSLNVNLIISGDFMNFQNLSNAQQKLEFIEKKISKNKIKHIILENEIHNEAKITHLKYNYEKEKLNYILSKIAKYSTTINNNYINISMAIVCRNQSNLLKLSSILNEFKLEHNSFLKPDFLNSPEISFLENCLNIISEPKNSDISLYKYLDYLGISNDVKRNLFRKSKMKEKSIFEILINSDYIPDDDLLKFAKSKIVNIKNKSQYANSLIKTISIIINEFENYHSQLQTINSQLLINISNFESLAVNYANIFSKASIDDFLRYTQSLKTFYIKNTQNLMNANIDLFLAENQNSLFYDLVIIYDASANSFPQTYKIDNFSNQFALNRKSWYEREEEMLLYWKSKAKVDFEIISCSKNEHYENNQYIKLLGKLKISETKDIHIKSDYLSRNSSDFAKSKIISEIISLLEENNYEKAKKKIDIISALNGKRTLSLYSDSNFQSELDQYKNLALIHNDNKLNEINLLENIYSVSQIQTYQACPKKYYYQYICRIQTEPKCYFDFGTSMHSVMEYLIPIIEENDFSNEILYSKAASMLEKFWISKGYINHKEEREYFDKGLNSLRNAIKKQKELMKNERKTIEREKRFNIEISGKKIQGIIDRIDKTNQGYEIIDYKTSNKMETPSSLISNLQLGIYALAFNNTKGLKPIKCSLWYLIHDNIVEIETAKMNFDNIIKELLFNISRIEQKDFNPTPNDFACRFCDYNKICPSSLTK